MKFKAWGASFRSFRQRMKAMSMEERIDYIWTYYKWEIALFLLGAFVLYGVISALCATPIETKLSGNITNCSLTDVGYHYLTQGYLQELELDVQTHKVDLGLTSTAGTQITQVNPTGVDAG